MRVIFLDDGPTILLCFILWFILQSGAALLCTRLPDSCFKSDNWLFRPRPFEKDGKLYEQVFKIRSWKQLLPDGGAVGKNGYAKRHIYNFSTENLERFLIESCRGELTHWLPLLGFWLFGFFTPPYVVLIMFAYALASNLPCIMAQRYNRPRVRRIISKIDYHEFLKEGEKNND